MLTQLIVTSAASSAWGPGAAREIALAKPPQFHIKNRITLIGFLGNDAITRTANNANFTVLSLATKSSYKDKKSGEYNSHTEWHRCIVWGRLADYAKTLTKGAHLHVEGELRSREQTNKKTSAKQKVWEVRVSSILKLDRAEKAAPEEADNAPEDTNADVPE